MDKYLSLFFLWIIPAVAKCLPTSVVKNKPEKTKTSMTARTHSDKVISEYMSGESERLGKYAFMPAQNSVADLTPTIILNDGNFSAAQAGALRDFIVTVNEVNNVVTQGAITVRIFKPSAFSITYAMTNGNSNVFPGVANSNSDWNFSETDAYITVTSKPGVIVNANSSKVIGFSMSRKTGVPPNTLQNISIAIVANSGGEQDASNNLTGISVNASEASSAITFGAFQLNPNGYAPLSAQLNFSAPASGKAFIRVRGKHGQLTYVEHTFNDNGQQHAIPLIGLYANYTNAVDIRVVNASGDTLAKSTMAIQAPTLSSDIALPTSIIAAPFNEADVAPGLLLVSSFSNIGTGKPSTPYFLDAYGDIRWVLDYRTHPQLNALSYDDGISRLRNGNFFFSTTTTSTIYEVDLLGNVINNWDVATKGYIFHHEVSEKPNGNFLLTATKPGSTYRNGSPTIEDYVVEIDRENGNLLTVWDLKESLDETRYAVTDEGAQGPTDWFHGNAVIHDSTDNTIVVSGRSQGVVKLDYTNRVKWILAAHKGWTTNRRGENLTQFLLQPLDITGNPISSTAVSDGAAVTSDFEWNWYQHNPSYMPNGDLLMFDNGSRREFDATPRTPYSRAVSYKIDPVNKTVQQTWTYGKERGAETFSNIVSSAQFLSQSRHIVFSPGYQVPNINGQGGKVAEIDYATERVVSEISISSANGWGFHRTKKMSAYP